jgi:hypothetical protein
MWVILFGSCDSVHHMHCITDTCQAVVHIAALHRSVNSVGNVVVCVCEHHLADICEAHVHSTKLSKA